MRKTVFILFAMMLSVSVMAQQSIRLRSADRADCVKSDMTGLRASFSFSGIDASNVQTTRGELSEIHIEGAYPNGNVGDPQLPMFTRLIAIPTGATPIVSVGSHSETDYTLRDYGIGTISAMQAPIRKSDDPNTVEYAFNEATYARNSYNDDPIAMVEVLGTMRGITLGRLIVQPIRYNPVAGTMKVFNDIEVSVDFQNGDAASTEQMFKSTCSPAFQSVYDQIFNIDMLMGRGTRDAYTDHPDMYNTPVKMLVICYSGFKNNSSLTSWLQWKLQKGYYVDIYYTDETGTTASAIASFIKTKYNASVSAGNAYTYLIVIGDTGQVPQYMTKNIDSSIGNCASDLGYSSVNFSTSTTNYFPDMYYSRISVENATHLTNYINKVLTYEKYEFTDGGNYLNNVILVGGWDSSWTSRVAKPTINYGTNYYFNSSNTTYGGFSGGTINATISTSSTQGYAGTNNGCYNGINNGVCFLNYTAHGDKQEWYQPQMTAAHVATLTNNGKYFFGVGNCCLTGNFNNTTTTYSPGSAIGTNACFAETMIRVPNAGAIAYVGCSPYSYWYEDFYWAVGAHSYSQGNYPSTTASSNGVYDVMFMDQYWNSASALNYVGNLAVQQAVSNNNTNSSITDGNCNNSAHYYFQFYHTFGDGSVMPYITKPETNTVTIPSTVTPGTASITVNAVAGSYVAVTDNSSVIYGVGVANSSGVATVNFTNTIPGSGTLYVVVTRQQYQPYFGTITVQGGTPYTITTNVNPEGAGTVTGGGTVYANTTCTLTAVPNSGWEFVNWNDGNTENPRSFTVTGNASYTANFTALTQRTITLASVMHGTISSDHTTAYKNDVITLTATPASGYSLESWIVFKTGDMNTTVTVNNNTFTMPDYDVTVSAIFSKPSGGDVTIGSGDATSNGQYLPTYAYYNYSLTQQIYTSSEVGDAGTITKVAFKVSNSKSTTRNLDIYLSHTSNSSFSSNTGWISQSTSYRVFSGDVTFNASGWTTITLSTPFDYNGTSNLLLTVDDNTGSYVSSSSNSPQFYTYSASDNSAIYKYNDGTDYNPASMSTSGTRIAYKNQVVFTKEVPSTEGYFSVSPTSLTGFEAVGGGAASNAQSVAVIGSNLQSQTTVTMPNGYEACTTSTGSYASTLTLMPTNGSLRQMLYVRLAANLGQGNYTGNMTIASGTTSTTISLSGTVTPGAGTSYTITATANPTAGGTVSGGGTYYENSSCTLTATANTGYTFTNWTQNGTVVSTDATYTFNVTAAGDYIANFTMNTYEVIATANPTTGGTITGEGTYNYGESCTLIATANEGYTFTNWTKDGTVVSNRPSYLFTVNDNVAVVANFTPNSYTITATANPAEGGIVTFGTRDRDELVYDFEDGIQGWTVLKGNTGDSPNNWHHNTTHVSYSNGGAHDWSSFGHNSSSGFMMSESYISATSSTGTAYGAVTPDNYLVSPQVRLGGSISFYAGARNTQYCAEKFSVMVSTTDNTNTDSFTTVATWILSLDQAGYNSSPYTVDLSAYSGMGYIAIRHWDCYDQWVLCVDDITIVEGENQSIGTGNYNYGETCHITATPNQGYYFVNWTENGTVVSTDAYYPFTVTGDRDLVANFSQTQQVYYTITATANPTEGGTVTGAGIYPDQATPHLIATPNEGYVFVNWTENGVEVSTNANYYFTADSNRDLVANFSKPQQVTLTAGWNWWSTYLDITLEDLEAAIGTNGGSITAQNGSVTYMSGYGWDGDFNTLDLAKMYKIEVPEDCQIVLNGTTVNPASYTITIKKGPNWIGFPVSHSMTLNEAFANLTPTAGDIVKSEKNGYATYLGSSWSGSLNALEPGQGYIYISKSSTTKTFTYSSAK